MQLMSNYYIVQGATLLKVMRLYHNMEYYDHRNRKVALLLSTYASIFLLWVFSLMGFYLNFCNSLGGDFNHKRHSDPDT